MSTWRSVVLAGGIVSSPIHEEHHRGKNWLAIIEPAPTQPGGLSRDFQPFGRGEFRFMVGRLALHDAVEFGADYVTTMGRKVPKRWFGVVVEITESTIAIEEVGSGIAAVLRSLEMQAARRAERAAALNALIPVAVPPSSG